jgi:hypothetical protein
VSFGRLRKNQIMEQFFSRLIAMLASPAFGVLSRAAHQVLARIEIESARRGGKENGCLLKPAGGVRRVAQTTGDECRTRFPRWTGFPVRRRRQALRQRVGRYSSGPALPNALAGGRVRGEGAHVGVDAAHG